jgi:hypothetical protein
MVTVDVATAPPAKDAGPARPRTFTAARLLALACLLVSCAFGVFAIALLIRSTFTGYEPTDEGFYLYAADPSNKANIANGLWGMYIGLLYRAVGYSLVGFRIAGVVVLAGCAAWLGVQAGRFLGFLAGRPMDRIARAALVVSTVVAAQLYYALMILTPSYNWLALCGLMLVLAGLFGVLIADVRWSRLGHIALISVGCFLTFWGRNVAGVGVWVLAQALVFAFAKGSRRDRLRLVAAGVGTLVVLGALHALILLDPSATLSAVNRAKSFNFTHGFSTPLGVLVSGAIHQVIHAPRATGHTARLWPLLGLAPALAWFVRPPLRAAVAAFASCASVLAVGGVLIATHGFDGGPGSYTDLTPSILALAVTAGLAWACSALLRRRSATTEQGLPRRAALLAGVFAAALLATQALYAFTSNNPLLGQSSGASVLGLLAVQLLLVAAVGRGRLLPAVLSVALLVPLAMTACLVAGRQAPYRDAPLAQATTYATINRHGARIRLAPQYAAYFTDLEHAATAAGFTPGTPLMDLTPFDPGAAEALGATAPDTLLFGYGKDTARWVLSQQDRAVWHDAWLLTGNMDGSTTNFNVVTSVVGRSFPADYELVTTVKWPSYGARQQLWRPRTP